ncbi:MAG TPA: hypothetical protein PLQ75_08835, partial [Anaerolineales bacterium]|nr:hypothetical protein [Anaerolineales bacterium]
MNKRLLLAWGLGILLTYIATGFLDSYYKTGVEILFVSLALQSLITILIYLVLGKLMLKFQQNRA